MDHEETGYRVRHDSYFTDSRTGRGFCHEHVNNLTSWELDGCPEDPAFTYASWISVEASKP